MSKSKFYMAGTDGTGEYAVVAVSVLGRIGYRRLDDGSTRVRVEPFNEDSAAAMATALSGWKQPDKNQFRFSMAATGNNAVAAMEAGLHALGFPEDVEFNPAASGWREELGGAEPETVEVSELCGPGALR